jgi:hypothetical protein
MKWVLLSITLIISVFSCMAQQAIPAFSLTVGSDFKGIMTTMGLEYGLYTSNRKHLFMATLAADRIANADLISYGKPDRAHPETSLSQRAHAIGIKYSFTVASRGPLSVGAVVHPWYSWNLGLPSVYYGARVTFWKRDIVAAELLHDPFGGRCVLRFVITTTFKKG